MTFGQRNFAYTKEKIVSWEHRRRALAMQIYAHIQWGKHFILLFEVFQQERKKKIYEFNFKDAFFMRLSSYIEEKLLLQIRFSFCKIFFCRFSAQTHFAKSTFQKLCLLTFNRHSTIKRISSPLAIPATASAEQVSSMKAEKRRIVIFKCCFVREDIMFNLWDYIGAHSNYILHCKRRD